MKGDDETGSILPPDKISHARTLLKKFQSKQHRGSMNGSDNISSAPTFNLDRNSQIEPDESRHSLSGTDSLCQGGTSQQHSRGSSSRASSTLITNNNDILLLDAPKILSMDRCHSVPKNFSTEGGSSASLRDAFNQKQYELSEALSKLQTLHKHYADLHLAYTQLSNKHSLQKNSSNSAFVEQIQQLRTALAVALDEKTVLQSELREMKQNQQRTIGTAQQLSYNPELYELESRINRLTTERDQLAETASSQSAQIEHQRRECSNLEAKVVLIQQDRIDTQARIKGLYAEKEQLEKALEQQRNELAMREIYLRQMARHTGIDHPEFSNNTDTQSQDTQKRFEEEFERNKLELGELRKQLEVSRERNQITTAESGTNIKRLETECKHLRSEKVELESSNNYMEEQLRVLREQYNVLASNNTKTMQSTEQTTPEIDPQELGRLKYLVDALTTEKEAIIKRLHECEHLIEEKDSSFDELRQALDEAQTRIVHLEQTQSIQSTMNTDVALLSAQLQNEKATVSRAVAQNIDLKSQLVELQEKLIEVINESAAKEDERISALAAIERLKKELNDARQQLRAEIEEGQESGETLPSTLYFSETGSRDFVEQSQQTDDNLPFSVNDIAEEIENSNASIGVQTEQMEDYDQQHKSQKNISDSENVSDVNLIDKSNCHRLPQNYSAVMDNVDQSTELNERLEALCRENKLYRTNNEKLEYWLTALESENESIGEYIALYRFQRGQLQHRMLEKDFTLQQLQQQNTQLSAQLIELHNAVVEFMGRNIQANTFSYSPISSIHGKSEVVEETISPASHNDEDIAGTSLPEQSTSTSVEEQKQQFVSSDANSSVADDPMDRLLRALERSKAIGSRASCVAAQQAQIHCTGCVECRGELCTL